MHRCRVSWLIVLLTLMTCAPVVFAQADDAWPFLTARGDQLYAGDQPFRFLSFNIPNLHLAEDSFDFMHPNPWRWPDEYEIGDALESIRQMGGTVVRSYVLSVHREGSDMGDHVFVRGPGEFNEEAFRVLDRVLAIAREKGIRVIVPLVDEWHWWGGRREYAAFRGKQADDFWTDRQLIDDFKQTIDYVLHRKNTITGVVYRDDPTLFGWETGNEIKCPPEWTAEIAAYLQGLDANHLVIDGCSLLGIRPESLDDPNVDVVSTHHYPQGLQNDFSDKILEAVSQTRGKKPYFVGEFGFIPTDDVRRVLDIVQENEIAGALVWSLRYHRREGGFYWHHEPAGGGIYKAYHWPGFASGEAYDERPLLTLLRERAHAIRGLDVPAWQVPAAPMLLPIERPSAISWQGSTGADRYQVERATSPAGPWKILADDVSDAALQYRPLFTDDSVKVGSSYFYRVKARNDAGVSEPSNVVGPVVAEQLALIDECNDLQKLSQPTDEVKIVGGDERKVQEDMYRIAVPPGGSIDYEVAGPIRELRVQVFSPKREVKIEATVGEGDAAIAVQRTDISVGSGDYGYFAPILLSGTFDDSSAKRLRIAVPSAEVTTIQISAAEIYYEPEE